MEQKKDLFILNNKLYKYRKSGIPLGVEIPAPARTTIRLYRPVLIESISLSTENDLFENRRALLRNE